MEKSPPPFFHGCSPGPGPRRADGLPVGTLGCPVRWTCPSHCGYTSGMKTAISLPDGTFRDAERLARRLKKSRSQLYQEAVAEYVARHEPEAITEAIDRLVEDLDTRPDEFMSAVTQGALRRSEW